MSDNENTMSRPSRHRRSWVTATAVAAAAIAGSATALVAAPSFAGAAQTEAVTTASTASNSASHPAHPVTVLRFAVKFSDHYVVDVPPAGANANDVGLGDYAVVSDQLLDRSGRVVGTEGGSGLVTKISATEAQVFFTLAIQLPHGQIAASGLSSPAPSKELAVVGGTGRYVGASGHLDLVENGDGTGSLVITLGA
jgi:hypothetical protein